MNPLTDPTTREAGARALRRAETGWDNWPEREILQWFWLNRYDKVVGVMQELGWVYDPKGDA